MITEMTRERGAQVYRREEGCVWRIKLTIRTNYRPRLLIDDYQLTPKEREEFDYLDWGAIEAGTASATFFRYKGQLYNLGEFMCCSGLEGWDGQMADSYFSGLVVKIVDDERIIVGQYFS